MSQDSPSRDFPPELRHLLYEDEDGVVIGLDEVQLLEPIPIKRVRALRALLLNPNLFLVYQAALILTAWGDPAGLLRLESMVEARVDREWEFTPHRIYDYDNVYDEMAQAVFLYGLSSDSREEDRLRVLRKLLALYGPCQFESKLKHALLTMPLAAALVPEMQDALERADALAQPYLASQMLPPLARWQGEAVRPQLERFPAPPHQAQSQQAPDPYLSVVEALGYLPGADSRHQLECLVLSPDRAVADEARTSLLRLSREIR